MKGGIPADVYATDFNFAYGDPSGKQRLRPHSFTIELEFVGIATGKSSKALFRRKDWLEDAHTYDFFGPQSFSCRGEQGTGSSFQGYPPEDPWSYPEPKHVIFDGSLDRIILNINTNCGAFLIKAGGDVMFVDNRLLPRLNVAAYRGEVSLDWKIMFNMLFKDVEAGERLREWPASCNSVVEMIGARPLCPNSRLLGPITECFCSFAAESEQCQIQALTSRAEGGTSLES